jgi:geranylgeranyl diphosphate synthase type I
MNFREYLQKNAKLIDLEIDNFFQEWSEEVGNISSRLLPLTNALADASRGGKRIRGSLVMLGYEMGLVSHNDILKVAVAYEIFQAAILAHDDIIDKSLLRRGEPSLYARLGGGHSGESLAICLGDIGFFLAFKLVASTGFPEKDKNKALIIFSKTMLETGIGELLDVELTTGEAKPAYAKGSSEVKDIITVYKFKTAYYTITAPLLLGAVLGGLSDSSLSTIRIFGQNLGIAFQIQDDINDIFSDKKQLGKELGGDIKEGKQTLLYFYAKVHANRQQKKLFEKYYGNSTIEEREIEVVKTVLVETGALEYARTEAREYSQKAKESIPGITQNERFKEILVEMSEYFIKE